MASSTASACMALHLRLVGNEAFKRGKKEEALQAYTQALSLLPTDPATLSNRSHVLLQQGRALEALKDSQSCLQVAPRWSKSYMRMATVCDALAEHAEAVSILQAGIAMQENEADKAPLLKMLATAQAAKSAQQLCARSFLNITSLDVATTLIHYRKEAETSCMADSLSQALGAPGQWMPEDWEWKPHWVPEWRLPRLAPEAPTDPLKVHHALLTGAACKAMDEGDKEATALLARLATGLASLESPRLAVQAILDGPRMAAFSKALHSAIAIKGPGKKKHIMCLKLIFKDRLFGVAIRGAQQQQKTKQAATGSAQKALIE